MKSNKPEITVLMSCYNAEAWLGEAIDSVLGQTFTDFEFILINDGSTDSTVRIIQSYADRDNRIVALSKKNTGLADSLNVGLARAQGEWIARLDADDLCEPMRLEEQINFVRKHPEIVLLGTGFSEINGQGQLIKRHTYPIGHQKLVKNLERSKRFFPHSSAFYRTNTVRQIGGYRVCVKRAEDKDLWLRLAEIGTIACLSAQLVKIRKHDGQISHNESGRVQIIDACSATTSYFIRQLGGFDPLSQADPIKLQEFFGWVEEHLVQDSYFERQNRWITARKVYFAGSNRLSGILSFGWYLCRSRSLMQLLSEKLFGSALAEQLAYKWLASQVGSKV